MSHSTRSRTIGSTPVLRGAVQARAQQAREDVILAAAKNFDLLGYSATSVNAILEGSSFAEGAIYHHFSVKEDIARQVVDDWNETFQQIISAVEGSSISAAQQVPAIFSVLARWVDGDTNLRAGMKLIADLSFDEASEFTAWVATVERLIDSAVATGESETNTTVDRLAWNLCVATVGVLRSSAVMREGVTILACIDDLVYAYLGVAGVDIYEARMK